MNLAGVRAAVVGAAAIAAVSTLGDFIWATWIPQHLPVYGLLHGSVLFLCIGFFLGALTKRWVFGTIAGALIGGAAAASFYALAPVAGYSIMFIVWIGVWIALGALNERLDPQQAGLRAAVVRGAIAAVTSGMAFYLVSGIWFPFGPRGWDYLVHFGAWFLAYLPGFAALLIARRPA